MSWRGENSDSVSSDNFQVSLHQYYTSPECVALHHLPGEALSTKVGDRAQGLKFSSKTVTVCQLKRVHILLIILPKEVSPLRS